MWSATKLDSGVMQISMTPVFQQILGGPEDGTLVWASFSMRLNELFAEPHLEVTEFGFRSYCEKNTPTPIIGIRGNYKQHPFTLTIHLEPLLESDPIEVIDTIRNQTRVIYSTPD
ncbi:MAG TPA: hypothetical protein PLY87_20970 [Planctomycetaceae bacterium]|nr:hypothetical protein [Planctomycetaceae bacterium]HQZ67581.1 hypothetical protein [Planctomycetaceae bacterium]